MRYDLLIKTIDPEDETVYWDSYYYVTTAQIFSLLDIAEQYCGRPNTKAWIRVSRG